MMQDATQEKDRHGQVRAIGKLVFIIGLVLILGSITLSFAGDFSAYLAGLPANSSNYPTYSAVGALGLFLIFVGKQLGS